MKVDYRTVDLSPGETVTVSGSETSMLAVLLNRVHLTVGDQKSVWPPLEAGQMYHLDALSEYLVHNPDPDHCASVALIQSGMRNAVPSGD